MATLARRHDTATRPVPWSPAAWRQALYLAGSIPAQLIALAAVLVPWWSVTEPSWGNLLGVRNWGKLSPVALPFLVIVFLAVPAFTAMHRHRLRTTAGVEIPPQPYVAHRWTKASLVSYARSPATWRQLGYHLLAAPLLAAAAIAACAMWLAGLLSTLVYTYAWTRQLHQPDFTTALRVSQVINKRFGAKDKPLALAENSALVGVTIPAEYANRTVEFVADLEELQVEADRPAKVIINERTGTIVMGKQVRVSPVAIMHGKLTVEIQTVEAVSQPNPLSQGKTAIVPEVSVGAKEEKSKSLVLQQGATVEQLVHALGEIGSTPRDVIAILQSLRAAGALEADVDVI